MLDPPLPSSHRFIGCLLAEGFAMSFFCWVGSLAWSRTAALVGHIDRTEVVLFKNTSSFHFNGKDGGYLLSVSR